MVIVLFEGIANTAKGSVGNDNNGNDSDDMTDFHNDFLSEEINNKQNNETELSHL
jgi:hypothetical protein